MKRYQLNRLIAAPWVFGTLLAGAFDWNFWITLLIGTLWVLVWFFEDMTLFDSPMRALVASVSSSAILYGIGLVAPFVWVFLQVWLKL